MSELKTGQHVQCLRSGDDMLAPGEVAWCEVKNWVSALAGAVARWRVGTHA
jgi:hypothetical protein